MIPDQIRGRETDVSSLTEWTTINFNTHRNKIIPLARIESYITCNNWIGEVISDNAVIISIADKILFESEEEMTVSLCTISQD